MKKFSVIPFVFSMICFLIYPFRLVQLVSIFIMLIYILSFLISKMMLKSLSVTRCNDIYYCQNGCESFSDIIVENRGIFPLDNIIIHDKASGGYEVGVGIFAESIPYGNTLKLSSKIDTMRRGRFTAGPIVVKGCDPLNLFPWSKKIDSYIDIYIYPKFSSIELLIMSGAVGGKVKVRNPLYEDLSQLESMREYRAGDSLKKINWKASAKSGTLQTMEFSNTLSTPLYIILDIEPERYPLKHRYSNIERAIEVASSIVTSYGEGGEAVGLFMNSSKDGVYIPQAKGYDHVVSIMAKLSEIDFLYINKEPVIRSFFNTNPVIPAGSHIYIIVPKVTHEVNQEIALLSSNNCIINILVTGGQKEDIFPPGYCNYLTMTPYGDRYYV